MGAYTGKDIRVGRELTRDKRDTIRHRGLAVAWQHLHARYARVCSDGVGMCRRGAPPENWDLALTKAARHVTKPLTKLRMDETSLQLTGTFPNRAPR